MSFVNLIGPRRVRPGAHSAEWDGRDDAGMPVAAAVYRYVIDARGGDGRAARHDPSRTGGSELAVREFIYDRDTRSLH